MDVTPDTVNFMILGYSVIFGVIAIIFGQPGGAFPQPAPG